jgi:hypothetical protein
MASAFIGCGPAQRVADHKTPACSKGANQMKRILMIVVATVALGLGGLLTSTASAGHPCGYGFGYGGGAHRSYYGGGGYGGYGCSNYVYRPSCDYGYGGYGGYGPGITVGYGSGYGGYGTSFYYGSPGIGICFGR